jgi:S1-C subfamily serine protease
MGIGDTAGRLAGQTYQEGKLYYLFLNNEATIKPPSQTEVLPKIKLGTGFAVSSDGYIVTACHVIQDAKAIKVYLSKDSVVSAKVIHSDPMNDLAVLKIESATPNFLQLAPMRSVKMGDKVFTIGFPVSSILGQKAKYTEGVISSISGIKDASSLLQITVPVQPGNSGGALVSEKGEVVGIITSSAAILPFIEESGTLPQNVNWAVKADYLRPLIELPEAEDKELNREQIIEQVTKATFFIEVE